ncbi:O-antigen ligase family protein [Flavobacteriaceae bacterium]|nr:O-antigen ligase family protein [Flavobacteriaceae bacterium]
MIIIATILLILYIGFIGFILKKTFKGDTYYLLLYILFTLPFYSTFQLIIFKGFDFSLLVNVFKFSKDFVFFIAFFVFIFGKKESIIEQKWQLTLLDKLFLGFMTLTLIYTVIPLGEAAFLSKTIYAKNTFLIGIVYFLGRNTDIDKQRWRFIVKVLIYLTIGSFVFALSEKIFGMHLQNVLDYGRFNLAMNDIFPTGNYGLSWTFERQGGFARYAAFFSNPLEFAASLLLFLSVGLYYLFHSKYNINRLAYLCLLLLVSLSFFFSYSRGAIISSVIIVFFTLFLEKKYHLMRIVLALVIISTVYISFFSSKELQYFFLDTLSFQNTSSLGHLLEWLEGVNSMIQNPLGVGIAMSGNANGVDQALKIGGENQFLIYGVQIGVLGLLIYVLMLIKGIKNSIKVFKLSSKHHVRSISFVAATTKTGLLIPLFTANAELYLFVAFLSWFLIGFIEAYYLKNILNRNIQ